MLSEKSIQELSWFLYKKNMGFKILNEDNETIVDLIIDQTTTGFMQSLLNLECINLYYPNIIVTDNTIQLVFSHFQISQLDNLTTTKI